MEMKKARSISTLVSEIDRLTAHFERCEYFRDNYKYVSLKVETESKRSGFYSLDISPELVKVLFDKELNELGAKVSALQERILELRLQEEE